MSHTADFVQFSVAKTNLIKDQEKDHVARIAKFAFDAIAAAKSTLIDVGDESKGFVTIRCGFHSGRYQPNHFMC